MSIEESTNVAPARSSTSPRLPAARSTQARSSDVAAMSSSPASAISVTPSGAGRDSIANAPAGSTAPSNWT